MKFANRPRVTLLIIILLSTGAKMLMNINTCPDFMSGQTSQLFYSNNLDFTLKGDIYFYEDYQTMNCGVFNFEKSHMSRFIYGDKQAVYTSYFVDFSNDNFMYLHDMTRESNKVAQPSMIQTEAHTLRGKNNRILPIVFSNDKVVCYSSLIEGGVKCLSHHT